MTKKYIEIVLDSTSAKKNADQLSNSVENIGESANESNESLREMSGTAKAGIFAVNKLALAVSAVISGAALKSVATMVQEYKAMAERIQMATKTTEEFNLVQARLRETADGTYRSLTEAQEIFLRTESSLEGLGYTLNQQIDIIDSMSYAFVRNTTSADRAEIAINSFGRAMAKGRLDADAWEMILVAIPTVIEDIAKSTGKTENEIRELGSSGKLSLTQLTEAFRQSRDENKKYADGMDVNLIDASVRAKNAFTNLFVEIENNSGLIEAITKGIISASESLNDFASGANNVNNVLESSETILVSIAAIIGGRLVASITASTAAFIQSNAAVRAKIISEQELALGIQRRSVVEAEGSAISLNAARADLAAANAKVTQARALAVHTQGTAFLNLALQQQLVAQERVNLAVVQSATASNAASAANVRLASTSNAVAAATTLAGRSLGVMRGALALLGGPAGVAFLAAAALVYYVYKADAATKSTDLLANSLDNLSKNNAASQIFEVEDALDGLTKRYVRLNISVQQMEQQRITMAEHMKKNNIQQSDAYDEHIKKLAKWKSDTDDMGTTVEKLTKRLIDLRAIQAGTYKPEKGPEIPQNEEVNLTPDTTPKDELNIQKEINEMMEKEKKQMEIYENEKRGAASVTQSLKMELASRQLASDNYRKIQAAENLGIYEQERILIKAQSDEELAEINKRQSEDTQRREEQLRQSIEHEELEQWQIAEIKKAYRDQELAAEQVYEEQRTAIHERAAQNRRNVDELEKKSRINSFISMGTSLMALGEGQSKKIFETGKSLALASAAVNLPSAVLESYNNSGGYPWGIPAAVAMGAVGLKQISDIKNARFGSTPSSSSQSAAPTPEASPSQGGGGPGGNFTVAGFDPRSLYTGEQLQGLGTALQDWWKNGGGDGTLLYQGN